jgi:uncharacterized protein (TIGR03084 family)
MMAPASGSDVFDDLEAEDQRLEAILVNLTDDQWTAPSAALGWSVVDVVVHLAQTDEAVAHTVAGTGSPLWAPRRARSLDEAMDQAVRAETDRPGAVLARWRQASQTALTGLREADPDLALPWAATPLKPRVLATTRLAEHWIHGLDITNPLHIGFPDTERLRHVAWLAHRTLPYAWSLAGSEAHDVFCELTGPSGEVWTFGPTGAPSVIRGAAGEFCRVGAQRLRPEASHLITEGPYASEALRVLRTYAA